MVAACHLSVVVHTQIRLHHHTRELALHPHWHARNGLMQEKGDICHIRRTTRFNVRTTFTVFTSLMRLHALRAPWVRMGPRRWYMGEGDQGEAG